MKTIRKDFTYYKDIIIKKFDIGSDRTRLIKKNIIYSFVLKGISVLIQLALVPLCLGYLDKEQYGIWLTLSSIITWFHFFDIGLGSGLRNRLTEALAHNDKDLGKAYVSTSYFLHILIFGSLGLIFIIVNPFLQWERILNTTALSGDTLEKLAGYIFIIFMFRFVLMQIGIISYSHQLSSLNNLFSTAANIISLVIIFLLRKFTDGNIIYLGITISIAPVIIYAIASWYLFKRKFAEVGPSIYYIQLRLSKNILNLGYKFLFVQLGAIVIFSSSNIIISQFFSPSEVTPYNIAYKYFQLPVMVYGIILSPFWSAFTDAYSKKDYSWLKNSMKRLNKLSFFLVIINILMLIVAPFAYKIWVGKDISVPFIVSLVMTMWATLNVLSTPYSNFINGLGKLNLSISLFWILVPLFFVLAFILIKTPLGYAGVMAATVIVNSVTTVLLVIQTRKIINRNATGIWNR
jgi:O-antigen/teichoic acid export membrane protein